MEQDGVRFEGGLLHIVCAGRSCSLAPASIVEVNACELADARLHADEGFHLVRSQEHFWLLGPFALGVRGALEALLQAYPALKGGRLTAKRVPWRMRAPGLWGLRLWPIAGLGRHPNRALRRLGIRAASSRARRG